MCAGMHSSDGTRFSSLLNLAFLDISFAVVGPGAVANPDHYFRYTQVSYVIILPTTAIVALYLLIILVT